MSSIIHERSNQTSSIGAVWPPEPSSFERIRGFYNQGIVDTPQRCQQFVGILEEQQDKLARQTECTRLSVRFVASAGSLAVLDSAGINLEAAIPLACTGSDMVLAYAATNIPDRRVGAVQVEDHTRLLQKVVAGTITDLPLHSKLLPRCIDRHTAETERAALVPKFTELYRVFGYSFDDVRTLLCNPANTIMYIEDEDDTVVSTAMAERANIEIEGFDTLSLVEITEACTHPTRRGEGLYRYISGLLTRELIDRQAIDPVHAIYGESNLAMPGVLIAGHENGRRFSHFDQKQLGIERTDFGILQQNFCVQDGHEQRPYNDFAVSYIPPQKLRSNQ